MRARCLICGKFYSEPGPEATVCRDHIPDWNAMSARDREWLVRAAIYRPPTGGQPSGSGQP